MNIVHIATRMRHHSSHSGYDRLSDYVPCEKFNSGWISRSLDIIPHRLWAQLLRGSKFYLVPEMKREIELQARALIRPESVFHFLYGENDFRRFRPGGKNKLFVTYHFPPDKYSQYFTNPPNLKRVNAVIVVGSNQAEYFTKWVPREKILFIPHGIDSEYYTPVDNGIRNNKILFVGTHLRDFGVLKGVIERIEKLSINLVFTIVTFKENWGMLRGLKNIELIADVTEEQLLKYYQSHALLFLPLIDGTANNTLLEGAACGIPIVISNVGAVKDYLDDKSAIIFRSGKPEAIASTIIDLLSDRNKRNELSANVRRKIVSFDWKNIAERMKRAYEEY